MIVDELLRADDDLPGIVRIDDQAALASRVVEACIVCDLNVAHNRPASPVRRPAPLAEACSGEAVISIGLLCSYSGNFGLNVSSSGRCMKMGLRMHGVPQFPSQRRNSERVHRCPTLE